MKRDGVEVYAKAEALLNSTLAYQAAIAVHQLKDQLGLRVQELRLTVAPHEPRNPSVVHVTCTIQALEMETRLQIELAIDTEALGSDAGRFGSANRNKG